MIGPSPEISRGPPGGRGVLESIVPIWALFHVSGLFCWSRAVFSGAGNEQEPQGERASGGGLGVADRVLGFLGSVYAGLWRLSQPTAAGLDEGGLKNSVNGTTAESCGVRGGRFHSCSMVLTPA